MFQGTWKKSVVLVENDLDVKLRGRVLSKPKVLKWMIKKEDDVSIKMLKLFFCLIYSSCNVFSTTYALLPRWNW